MSDQTVTLGQHEVPVYPQRHAYITHRLGKLIGTFVAKADDIDETNMVAVLGSSVYDVLAAMLPQYGKRCPRYEFLGYDSQEAYDGEEYDPDKDQSPTIPEQLEALRIIAEVNRFDAFKAIGKVFDPNLLRAQLNLRLASALSGSSANSPSGNAGSDLSMSSGTTDPTSPLSEA